MKFIQFLTRKKYSEQSFLLLIIGVLLIISVLLSNCHDLGVLNGRKFIEADILDSAPEINSLSIDAGTDKGLKSGDEYYMYIDAKPIAKIVIEDAKATYSDCYIKMLFNNAKYPQGGEEVTVSFSPPESEAIKKEEVLPPPTPIRKAKLVEFIKLHFKCCAPELQSKEESELLNEWLDALNEIYKFGLDLPQKEANNKEKKPRVLGVGFENSIIINIGKQHGVKEGNIFYIYRDVYFLGKVCVNKVFDKFSLCIITDDSKYKFEMGDDVIKERKKDEGIINNDIEKQFRIMKRDTESPIDEHHKPPSLPKEDKPKEPNKPK